MEEWVNRVVLLWYSDIDQQAFHKLAQWRWRWSTKGKPVVYLGLFWAPNFCHQQLSQGNHLDSLHTLHTAGLLPWCVPGIGYPMKSLWTVIWFEVQYECLIDLDNKDLARIELQKEKKNGSSFGVLEKYFAILGTWLDLQKNASQ